MPCPAVCCSPRHSRERGDPTIGASKAQSHQIGMKLFQRSALFVRPPSLGLQPARKFVGERVKLARPSRYHECWLDRTTLRNFAIVLRDNPVRRLISRIESFSRSAIRRMMFKSPMWITPLPPSLSAVGEGSHGSILNGN